MKQTIQAGKTVDDAIEKACDTLGVERNVCQVEVLKAPKKSFFGLFRSDAQVKVTWLNPSQNKLRGSHPLEDTHLIENNDQKLELAHSFLQQVIVNMGLENISIRTETKENEVIFTINSDHVGILIGHHGETLNALQYLTGLVANRIPGRYFRVILNCSNYREKREEILKNLARKIAYQVRRTGKNQVLEPMFSYERRIIHAEISSIDGVGSKSTGDEPKRSVLVFCMNRRS